MNKTTDNDTTALVPAADLESYRGMASRNGFRVVQTAPAGRGYYVTVRPAAA